MNWPILNDYFVFKPKYIENLLRTAELRKVELERRTERKVQKERETEGDQFNDKESFVTPAYRAKLAELKKLEEEERIRELREGKQQIKLSIVCFITKSLIVVKTNS